MWTTRSQLCRERGFRYPCSGFVCLGLAWEELPQQQRGNSALHPNWGHCLPRLSGIGRAGTGMTISPTVTKAKRSNRRNSNGRREYLPNRVKLRFSVRKRTLRDARAATLLGAHDSRRSQFRVGHRRADRPRRSPGATSPNLSIAWIESNVPYTTGPMAKFLEGLRKAGLH